MGKDTSGVPIVRWRWRRVRWRWRIIIGRGLPRISGGPFAWMGKDTSGAYRALA